jgi:N-acetylneuraminic acid mutarotase
MHDVLSQVANTEAPDVRSINSDVPRDLATICSRCLQKDPQRRYSSALELSRDLDRFMRDEPILARPVGHIEKLWRLCRRYPAACSLTMLLLALLVFAIKTLVDRPLVPHMPILNGTGASGVIRGKLYMVNSADGYSGIKNRLFVYDPGLNTWEPLRAMPIPHGACAYSVLGAKFYLAGGIDWKGKTSGELDVFDPAQNFWATKASMPTPRENCAGAAFNGRFYVTGGASEGEPRATLEVYEALTDTWAIATPMHKPRAGHAAVVVDGKLFVVGGGTGKSGALPEATVEVYDCSKGAWSVATSMPEPRSAAFVVAFNKIIYVAGGAGPAGETGTMQAYNTLTGRWQQLASMPASSYGGAGAQVMNNRIWFLGGWTLAQDTVNKMDVVAHNEVFIYDPARNSWTMSGHH